MASIVFFKNGARLILHSNNKLITLPIEIDPNSIAVIDAKTNQPRSFIFANGKSCGYEKPTELTTPNIGESVIVATKNGVEVSGIISGYSPYSHEIDLKVEDGDIVKIFNVEFIKMPAIVSKKTPTVKLNKYDTITIMGEGQDFIMSVLLPNASWRCIANATIVQEGEKRYAGKYKMTINYYAKLNLEFDELAMTSSEVDNVSLTAQISLVDASPKWSLITNHPHPMVSASYRALSSAPAVSPISENDDFLNEDYLVFGGNGNSTKITLKPNQTPTFTFNQVVIDDVRKIYEHHVGSDVTKLGYEFFSPQRLPSSEMNVYYFKNGLSLFYGQKAVEEWQKGQRVQLILANVSSLRCETSIDTIKINDEQAGAIRYETKQINVTIYNHTDDLATVILKYYLGDYSLVESSLDRENYELKNGELSVRYNVYPMEVTTSTNEASAFKASFTITIAYPIR
jgi:hypothetical protein